MLENIKLMLELTDDTYDQVINLYLSKVQTVVIAYVNISEIVEGSVLASFVEDKVVSIMKTKVGGGSENNREIKSISRGDTKIDYNVGGAITDTSKGAILSEADKKYLNSFKPTSWRLL